MGPDHMIYVRIELTRLLSGILCTCDRREKLKSKRSVCSKTDDSNDTLNTRAKGT